MPSDLEAHEKVCAERYTAINGTMASMHDRLNAMSNRMWAAAVGVAILAVTTLLTGVGAILMYLLTKAGK